MDIFNNATEFARVLGLLIPLLIVLVTKEVADQRIRAVLSLVLAAAAGVTATLVAADGGWDWSGFFNAWLNAFIVSLVSYLGVYKPTGIAPALASATADVGIGGLPPEPGASPDTSHGLSDSEAGVTNPDPPPNDQQLGDQEKPESW
jgi:hypothetical protein